MTEPTDAELIAFAVETGMRVRTGKGVVTFARAVLDKWGQPAPQQEAQEPSPTAGMNIAQRILHVGGRNPPGSTYVEFGSIQAVEALVKHVLRDLQPSPAAQEGNKL